MSSVFFRQQNAEALSVCTPHTRRALAVLDAAVPRPERLIPRADPDIARAATETGLTLTAGGTKDRQ